MTKDHTPVTLIYAALVLLLRLKGRYPSASPGNDGFNSKPPEAELGHRLFICTYMISAKAMIDSTYSNKTWCIVTQNLFALRELNQMESKMCSYLDWELIVNDPILTNFEKKVKDDFGEDQSNYPGYPTTSISKCAARYEAAESIFLDKSRPVPGYQVGNNMKNMRQERNSNINGVDTSPLLHREQLRCQRRCTPIKAQCLHIFHTHQLVTAHLSSSSHSLNHHGHRSGLLFYAVHHKYANYE